MLDWLISAEGKCESYIEHVCTPAAKYNLRSVLEWAIQHGAKLDSYCMYYAAESGHLTLVRWLHEERHVFIDVTTTDWAVKADNIELMQYVMEKGAELTDNTLRLAAKYGSKNMVQWLHDEHRIPWSSDVCTGAAENGHLSLLQYLHLRGCEWDDDTTDKAAEEGHLDVLQWAIENGCPFKIWSFTLHQCAEAGRLDVLQYIYHHDPKGFLTELETDEDEDDDRSDNDETTKLTAVGLAAENGYLSVVQFIYSLQPTCYYKVLCEAVTCWKPSALEVVQWLVDKAHFGRPPSFLKMRREMRLDVAEYLKENGMMYEEENTPSLLERS